MANLFTFKREEELRKLGRERMGLEETLPSLKGEEKHNVSKIIGGLTSQINDLMNEKELERAAWAKMNVIVQRIESSCTCHRCLEGRQTCGYTIKYVAKVKDDPRPLPTHIHSSSHGFKWGFGEEEPTSERELDIFWGYGETPEEAIEDLEE